MFDRRSWYMLCVILATLVWSACGTRASMGSAEVSSTEGGEALERVDSRLIREVDRLISLEDWAGMAVLAADLRDQAALLAFFRSSRWSSLAAQLQRLESALGEGSLSDEEFVLGEGSSSDVRGEGTWGGDRLLGWVRGLQEWELTGAPEASAFEGLGCADYAEDSAQWDRYGECILRNVDAAFQQADASLTALQRASMGDLAGRARGWLMHRALPLLGVEIGGAEDVTLQLARAWTGAGVEEDGWLADGALIAVRIDGVNVAYRPSLFGEAVFLDGQSHRCTWPGERVFAWSSGGNAPEEDVLNAGLAQMGTLYALCSSVGPDYAQDRANVAVDAGVRWNALAPVLRTLLDIKRQPQVLVRDVSTGVLSGLPVQWVRRGQSGFCGVEAHLRRDGVVLRGGGAPTHLVSWTDVDAFTQLTAQAVQAVERCDDVPAVQVVIDEPSVDWGLVVRVLERMSWPQVCADGAPCVETALVVGR